MVMLSEKWQVKIKTLQKDIGDEIAKIEEFSNNTVRDYICVNNLNSKLKRLEEISKILSINKYKLVFIGTIGEGKTTAICHLFNLIHEAKTSKMIRRENRSLTELQELLSTGSGRTTICEVIIESSSKTCIQIDPYTPEEMERIIIEFCESFVKLENSNEMISKELETAIRNVIELKKVSSRETASDKKRPSRIDKVKEELEKNGIDGLKTLALHNANLENRIKTEIEFTSDEDEHTWLKNTFKAINTVELKDFAIPKKIRIYVSDKILLGSSLSKFQAVIDTKGIDENPIRKDLQEYIESPDTICLFATSFKDAPETNIRELMQYHLSSKSRDFHHRFVTFVITQKGEPEKVNDGDGSWEVGTEIRREDIESAFKNLNLEFFSENIIFYDALRYYRSDIIKLDDFYSYTNEHVQKDRDACIQSIISVIDRRTKILQDEVESIKSSFQKIKEGDLLTDKEVEAIDDAVQKIKNLRNLNDFVPSFVYEDFIKEFIDYYDKNYKAWNTKDAIHRNCGLYSPRNINIYFDARIVAEGVSEDKMLRKFTKEAKEKLKKIFNDLKDANEALEKFIPELISELDFFYDNFIDEVGQTIKHFLFEKKLSPQNTDSAFWKTLINERGKQRPKRETYANNVCQTFRHQLESDPNANLYLRDQAEQHWASLIGEVLQFFGES